MKRSNSWTEEEDKRLVYLVTREEREPGKRLPPGSWPAIARILGRTADACIARFTELRLRSHGVHKH